MWPVSVDVVVPTGLEVVTTGVVDASVDEVVLTGVVDDGIGVVGGVVDD